MSFWSGEKLLKGLKELQIVDPYDPNNIDCSAYELTLGPEFFISPDYSTHVSQVKKHRLRAVDFGILDARANPGEEFVIPPGQFAYLLTEEVVKIPVSAMGFISLKFGVKGPGLINVSGFHVDPGYHGRLIFSVYNAGPSPSRLRRRQRVFLLWLADLDQPSAYIKSSSEIENISISEDMISKADKPVHSLQRLSDRIEELSKQVRLLNSAAAVVGVIATIIVAAIGIGVTLASVD